MLPGLVPQLPRRQRIQSPGDGLAGTASRFWVHSHLGVTDSLQSARSVLEAGTQALSPVHDARWLRDSGNDLQHPAWGHQCEDEYPDGRLASASGPGQEG